MNAVLATLASVAASLAVQSAEEAPRLPDGFEVRSASDFEGSLLTLAPAAGGVLFVGRESAGIARLHDVDGDGFYELAEEFAPELTACQGLVAREGELLASGLSDGRFGIWRVPIDAAGKRSGAAEPLYAFTDGGEHGPHALVLAPDGALYTVVGNHADFADATSDPLWSSEARPLLEPFADPLGHGANVRYPCGFVAQLDTATRRWRRVAVGLRNVYDIAVDPTGRWFGVDSDMEWDLGLPWYRPVRLVEIVEGADYGSRPGSAVIPGDRADMQPALLELPRGSPAGALFGQGLKFREPWRSALFSADWASGEILAVWTNEKEGGARFERFAAGRTAWPVTDLAASARGELLVASGGRGARGRILRIVDTRFDARAKTSVAPALASEARATAFRELTRGDAGPARRLEPELLRRFDPAKWCVELNLAAAVVDATGLVERASAEDFDSRLGALFLSSRSADVDVTRASSAVLELWDQLRSEAQSGSRDAKGIEEREAALLRALELILARGERPQDGVAQELARRCATRFAELRTESSLFAQIGVLWADLSGRDAAPAIFERMANADPAASIDAARALVHALAKPGPRATNVDAVIAGLPAYFRRADDFEGGISLHGYLAKLRARWLERASQSDLRVLLALPELDALSLALVFARLDADSIESQFDRFERALDAIDAPVFGSRGQQRKDAALAALAGIDSPRVGELARRLCANQGGVLEQPWALLETRGDERDFPMWLGALASPSASTREHAFRALQRGSSRPKDAATWRALLDGAREFAPRRSRELMRTLARWCGEAGGTVGGGSLDGATEFERELAAVEAWYAAAHPNGPPPAPLEARPAWSEAEMLAFLERSSARAGVASAGRRVFESASCHTCHAVGSARAADSQGVGPDLAQVSARLSTAEMLAAIVAPSRAVSDQYRAHAVFTHDERQFEGQILRRDERGIELRTRAGVRVELDAAEIESVRESSLSPMPDGLLDGRSLEELKDLFEYLRSGAAEPASPDWAPLFGARGVPGWVADSAIWNLRGETMVGRSTGMARSSYLLAPMPAPDLWIEFDVLLPPGANSGLCYRAQAPDGDAFPDPGGYQADLGQSYWGSLYVDGAGTLARAPESLEAALDRGGWNHVLVRVEGARQHMEINGLTTFDLEAPSARREGALFGFQVHQGKPMSVRIANARWRAIR